MAENNLTITRLNIRLVTGHYPLKASVDISIDDAIQIHGLRIIERRGKAHVVWPTREGTNGVYHPIVAPVSDPVRSGIEKAILQAYESRIVEPEGAS